MSRKRGKLSLDEEKYIQDSVEHLSIAEIAVQINRTEDTVLKYCLQNRLTYQGMTEQSYEDTILKQKLVTRPYWAEVQNQFTDNELRYFCTSWINMIKQFNENILYTEELQCKQWITLEILCNRVMKDRKSAIEQIERLQVLLDREYDAPEEVRNGALIAGLETEISMVRNSLSSYTTEHTKLLEKIASIQKDLRAARADRVKVVEDSKTSWTGFLKALAADEELRGSIGEDLSIMKLAKDKAKKKYSKFHKYEDGQFDRPLLNSESVKNGDSNG